MLELLKLLWAGLCWFFIACYRMTSLSYRDQPVNEVPEVGGTDECPMRRGDTDPVDDHVRRRTLNNPGRGSSDLGTPSTRCDVPEGGRMVGFEDEMSEFPLRNGGIRTPPLSSTPRYPQFQGAHHMLGGGGPRSMSDTYQYEQQVRGLPSEDYRSGCRSSNSVPCHRQQNSFGSFQTAPDESLLQGSFQSGRFKSYKPEKYDGTSDWTDYLKHFEIVATWNGWSEMEKAAQLSMSMTGVARQAWADSCSDISVLGDYKALIRHMGQRFKPEGQEESYKAEFRSRIKRKDETFLEYGYALRRLVIRAFPRLSHEGREELVRDQFVMGLSDAEMRRHVSLSHPETLDKAITLATEFEVISQSIRVPFPQKPKPVSAVQDTASPSANDEILTQVLEAIHKLSQNQSRPRRGQHNIRCYECQELGHVKRHCLQLKQVNSSEKPLN